jgi:hypothetical protein
MMPVGGSLTLVAALSYAGQLGLTALACPDYCPDLDMFRRGVRGAPNDLVPRPSRRHRQAGDTASDREGESHE